MQPLEIKKYPDSVLRQKSLPVMEVTQKERELLEKMLYTMRVSSGIGLAAPQVGILKQLIVADIGEGPVQLANPQAMKTAKIGSMAEGCLSVPGAVIEIERPTEVIVTGLNERGKPVEIKASGLMAVVLQHEIDHLRGKLIVDYMSFLEKIKMKFIKQDKNHADL